jgi:5-methylcytosine-specific restriction protein A
MAARPKTICRKVACGALVDEPGYCAKHAQQAVGWNRSHGDKSSTERGYGADWRKRRARVLSRDCGLCKIKGPGCTIVAREVDHKVNKERARAMGWTDDQIEDDANLQSACPTCHAAKTQKERGGRVESLGRTSPGPTG